MAAKSGATLPLPTGTVTFLFTDIEGSTRLWEQFRSEMGAALARHDALLRAAIRDHDGYVFATGGDAFCAAFHTAADGLAAARDAQLALGRETWPAPVRTKVRMALHTGAAEFRDNDYFGAPLNRVARLLAAGHGGQVLLSLATQELVHDGLPDGVTLRDMGERRLKDLIRPERVYQLVAPDLPADFPPLKTLDARSHNLPIQLTSFVGRDREMQEVKTLLLDARLVTLTGAGGAGKTRLSLQVGAELVDGFADGTWFVELAPLTEASLVPQAVATILGVKEQPGRTVTETLVGHLKDRELLVLLDNCEHLVKASAQLCQTLLAACAKLRVLATSREALRVPGERPYRVPSLATPGPRIEATVEALTPYAAVQLFIDRAVAVKPDFRVDNRNAPAVASICHHLDGIPLAIELAAARLNSMAVEEANRRLDQRFRLLTGGARTSLPRQQTLRSAIDWSYDLLGVAEQALFCRLSVFAGGWRLEAAEHVCSGDGVSEDEVSNLLSSLVDKSLVMWEERDRATRYRLLETVREYARDRLRKRSEEAHWLDRHLAHIRELAEAGEPHMKGPDEEKWFERFEAEHDNLRAALAWASVKTENVEAGLRLSGALARFWNMRGYWREGRGWLTTILAAAPGTHPTPARASALAGAGTLARHQGDYAAAWALYDEGLAIWREIGDRLRIARVLSNMGGLAWYRGRYATARTLLEEALAIDKALGNDQDVADALLNLGLIAVEQGNPASARLLCEESLAICRTIGNRQSIAHALLNLGVIASEQRDFEAARELFGEALAISRELRQPMVISRTLMNLAMVALAQGNYASAQALYDEVLPILQELGDEQGTAFSLAGLGTVGVEQGDISRGQQLLAQSMRIFRRLGKPRDMLFALYGLADVASHSKAFDRAARVLGGAERIRAEAGAVLSPYEQHRYERQVAGVRAGLGDDTSFDRAWQEGRAMTVEETIDYALDSKAPSMKPGRRSDEGERPLSSKSNGS